MGKLCTQCGESKDLSRFRIQKQIYISNICKDCTNKRKNHLYNPEKRQIANRKYYIKNKKKYKAPSWVDVNDKIKIGNRLRCRLRSALKKSRKASSTWTLVGLDFDEFKVYLLSQFVDGMTWDKFLNGEIHIDHKIPCTKFDLSKTEEQKKCFHYSNLQPLWAVDNLKKNKY